MKLNEQKPGRKSPYTPEQRALLARAARRRATKKRVTETTFDRVKRLEASVTKYLRQDFDKALAAAAAEISREDGWAIDAAGKEPVKPAAGRPGRLDSSNFLSELYSV